MWSSGDEAAPPLVDGRDEGAPENEVLVCKAGVVGLIGGGVGYETAALMLLPRYFAFVGCTSSMASVVMFICSIGVSVGCAAPVSGVGNKSLRTSSILLRQ